MNLLLVRLLGWWKDASPKARWGAGIGLFSLLCTGALLAISSYSPAAATTAAATLPDSAPSTALDASPWYFLDVLLKMLFVIGLIVGCSVIYRHFAGKQPFRKTARRMEVVETMRLSAHQTIHLMRVGDRLLLVGATDQSLALLTEIDDAELVVEPSQPDVAQPEAYQPADFGTLLSALSTPRHL